MKRILQSFALLLAVLSPTFAVAYDFEVDGIYYILHGRKAIVTYKGQYPYSEETYRGNVSIPSHVSYNGRIYSIEEIGEGAFYDCRNLTSVVIPNSVNIIGESAFLGCTKLTSITVPNSVTIIGWSAFYGCYSLSTIIIPNSVNQIGNNAFTQTQWYNDQPDGVVYAGLFAYDYKGTMANNTSISIKDGTIGIADCAFSYETNLAEIDLPNSVNYIGEEAFRGCTGLTSITLPNSVTTIGRNVFDDCTNLSDLNIGYSVTYVGNHAFEGTSWYNNQPNGLVYAGSIAYKYKGAMPAQTNIILKKETLVIASSAFDGCSNLVSITIPNSLVYIGGYAFRGCSALKKIDIPNSLTSIEECTFTGCSNLSSITIPNNVTNIGNAAFSGCYRIKSISIPETVKSIGNRAFYTNSSLSVTILGDIETVDMEPFGNVTNLIFGSNVKNIPGFNMISNNIYSFSKTPPICDNSTFSSYTGTLHVPAASLAAYFTAPIWENFDNMVGNAVEPLSVNLSQNELEIPFGETALLTATVLPNNAYPNTISWSSSNTDIATVENGTVTAVAAGECDIIATCLDQRAICHVVIKDVTISIYLGQNEAQVLPNHIITLTPTASSEVLPELAVSSSDPSIASGRVSNGIIRIVGIKEGTTTITVGSVDGTAIPASCLVTVYTEIGDLNMDGFVNMDDLTAIINYLVTNDASSIKLGNADVNHSGRVDMDDLTRLINYLVFGEF